MIAPERRTRADVVAALVIALVVAVTAGVIWWTSDARATESRPAATQVPKPVAAKSVPASLRELWTAPSGHTTMPVVAAGAVVSGDGGTVAGRDPVTGQSLWTFRRDRELCGVTWLYRYAVAVYPDSRGCGQVSTVDAGTGRRGPTRSGYADKTVTLSSDGSTVLSAGPTRLETWRSDMVRVIGYGEVDARVKPNQVGVGKGCELLSATGDSSNVAVIQACPNQADLKLTLLRAADQDDEPEVRDVPLREMTADSGARVLAVSDTSTAVYVPLPQPRLAIFDETGNEVASEGLDVAPSPEGLQNNAVTRAAGLITWWTGHALVVFDSNRLAHRYTLTGAGPRQPVGPATAMADKLLVPLTEGVGVYEASAGTLERVIPVDRGGYRGPVVPNVVSSTLIEQRGGTLVALG